MKSQKNILKSIEGLSDIELFVIDLFCGAGGLSEGVEEHDWMEIDVERLFAV